ncbi:hypothetical protein RUM44_010022 [Polyplax serrata]|uniref:Uncharacterized protein n=1 Tax=Polyplax serrata TaxID=468196 RepID=A0ABR1AUC7_POLSC
METRELLCMGCGAPRSGSGVVSCGGRYDSKKVRVSFFESERPHLVQSPEPGDIIFDVFDSSNMMTSVSVNGMQTPQYQRQASTRRKAMKKCQGNLLVFAASSYTLTPSRIREVGHVFRYEEGSVSRR